MISNSLISLVRTSEGFSAVPYRDSVGVWTIGYGFTHLPDGTPISQATAAMSIDQANEILGQLLEQYIHAVNAMGLFFNENQKDALVDFAYNLGIGSLRGSTLLKLAIEKPDNPAIRNEFMKWTHAGGEVLPGLVTRRKAEADLYFTPINAA